MADSSFQLNYTEEFVFDSQDGATMAGFGPHPSLQSMYTGWIVFQIVFYVCVIIMGVLGNSLILHVYSIKTGNNTNKTTTCTLVKVLAVSDLFVCLFRFRNFAFLHAAATQGTVSPAILYLEIPDKIAIANTVVVTGVIAFDRYDCVCRPYSRFLTYKRSLVAAVGCVVLSVIANLPLVVEIFLPSFSPLFIIFLKTVFQVTAFLISFILIIVCYSKVYYRIRQHVKVGVGKVEVRPRAPLGPNASQKKAEQRVVSTLTSAYPTKATNLTIVNLSTVGASTSESGAETAPAIRPDPVTVHHGGEGPTVSPAKRLKKYATVAWAGSTQDGERGRRAANDEGESSRNDGQRNGQSLQRKTTRMLFLTSVVFILTWLPQGVYAGTTLTGGSSGGSDAPPVSADAVFNLKPILFLNNVVNPFIYGIANRRFRKDCIFVLRKIFHR